LSFGSLIAENIKGADHLCVVLDRIIAYLGGYSGIFAFFDKKFLKMERKT